MDISEAKPKMVVAYVPTHAQGNIRHPDAEWGQISSFNDETIFVKFDKELLQFGWDNTTAKGCYPCDLKRI